jgi:GH25 family lysozyme M1 (1,4-beta-N-acetylmuramidase)
MINLRVVDIYHGDKVTSFPKAVEAGIWGIIHKATTGATGRDDKYSSRRKDATNAGLLWGAYHWGTKADVTAQVHNFLEYANPDQSTLVALDFERTGDNTMTLDHAREFLKLIAVKLNRKAVIYSGDLVKTGLGDNKDPFFGSHRLWLAHYNAQPKAQKSWEKYWLWQYADRTSGLQPNTVPGIPGDAEGNLDCNAFDGTREQLKAAWAS